MNKRSPSWLADLRRHGRTVGVMAGLASKLATDLTSLRQLLPLPEDLYWHGWFFAVGTSLLACRAVHRNLSQSRPHDLDFPDNQRSWAWVNFVMAFSFGVLFWFVEWLWKAAPIPGWASDVLYHWFEPLIYGAVFAFLTAAVMYAIVPPSRRKPIRNS